MTPATRHEATYRDATSDDIATLLALIGELAEYERLSHEAVATRADLHDSLFGATPRAHALLAERDGMTAGMAVFFFSFSTFTGRPSLYVEDVFVRSAHRGQGIGRGFFRRLAVRAVTERCGRMEWSVLDWNQPALDFYRALGAEPRAGWTTMRLVGDGLAKLADSGSGLPLRCPSGNPDGSSKPLAAAPDPPPA